MKIWRVQLRDTIGEITKTLWGTATNYNNAAEFALFKAKEGKGSKGFWIVEEVVSYGEKEF